MTGWPVATVPGDYVVGHVRAVGPDQVIDDAQVVVRAGVIHDVRPHPPGATADLDGRGLYCLPGLVDVHSDSLAGACRPRPGAAVPVDFALRSVESALLACGVTTVFHGVAFQTRSAVGLPVGSPGSDDVYDGVLRAAPGRVDHRVLHRVDVRCPTGVSRLRRRLTEHSAHLGAPTLVSHEDHTPGQGQYADPETVRRWLVEAESMAPGEAAVHVDQLRAERDEQLEFRAQTLRWLGELAQAGRIRLVGHDPASETEVEALATRGGRVAEFPTTTAAAKAARDHGLHVVVGAPNILRGRSHCGNVSAAELVGAGLADAVTSDYLPPALLAAATELARLGMATLPAAIGLVTSGPAAAAGLADRGSLVPGQRADLVLADLSGRWPVVHVSLPAARTAA